MESSERSFNENLDMLIKLLRKLKDKESLDNIPGMPKMFFANFDFVIQNYEKMKGQISDQLLSQFGEPIKQMIADMVDQLKDELGDDIMLDPDFLEEEKEEKKRVIELPESLDVEKQIEQIDILLKNPDLGAKEMDQLLDKRSQLAKQKTDGLIDGQIP